MTIKGGIIGALFVLAVLATALQCLIGPNAENIGSSCIVLASSLICLLYISWTDALETQPVSTFSIFGFCLTTQLGALIAQTASWMPLISSLYDPVYTFLMLALYQAIALFVHTIYRFLTSSKQGPQIARGVLGSIGLYQTPSIGTVWIMGCVGTASFAMSSIEGPLGKVGDGINFLIWAPFLIPIYLRKYGSSYCNPRVHIPFLVLHVAGVVVIALGLNIRLIMFTGCAIVGLNYLLIGMRSNEPVRWNAVAKMGALAVLALILSKPLSYVTTAMAVAHAARGKVTAEVMIEKTFQIMRHPALIEAFRVEERKESLYSRYDEHYLVNPMVARFVETKFHDNAFHFARMLNTDDARARLKESTVESIWFTLPGPIIDMLGLKLKKAKKGMGLAASNGDYLAYLARGVKLGGYKTGSVFAQGLVLFGVLFPFVYAGICWVMFAVMDLLTVKSKTAPPFATALVMMNSWRFFQYGITADGLDHLFLLVVRYFLQMILFYSLVYAAAKLLGLQKSGPLEDPSRAGFSDPHALAT